MSRQFPEAHSLLEFLFVQLSKESNKEKLSALDMSLIKKLWIKEEEPEFVKMKKIELLGLINIHHGSSSVRDMVLDQLIFALKSDSTKVSNAALSSIDAVGRKHEEHLNLCL